MRKVVLVVGGLVVVVALAYIVLGRRGRDAGTTNAGSAPRGSAATRAPEQPSLGSGLDPKDPVVQKFQQRKADGLAHLQAELEARVRGCEQAAGSSAPSTATPRSVALTLDRDDSLSTPELQRYVVAAVDVVQANEPVSAESRRCLDRLVGATLNVLLSGREMPADARQLHELVSLPLR